MLPLFLPWISCDRRHCSLIYRLVFIQEDISRLRRKLETTKKPDMVPNCDEILMEEIKDYKVRSCLPLPS